MICVRLSLWYAGRPQCPYIIVYEIVILEIATVFGVREKKKFYWASEQSTVPASKSNLKTRIIDC